MKEQIDRLNYKHRITLFTFLFFLILCALCPLSGDDLRSSVIGRGGLLECIKNIDILDGRIVSSFFVNFFSYNKLLFDISFAFLISYFVKICNDLMGNVKSKYFYLYPLIGVLLVSTFTFSYSYMSINSCVCYTFPTLLFFIYFYNLIKEQELGKGSIVIQALISIFITLSNIHIAIIFLIANILYFLIFKIKKIDIKYIILIILQVVLISISLFNIKNNFFYTSYEEIINNTSYFIESIFSENIVLMIIGAIPINFYLSEKLKGHIYSRVVITIFDIILIFSLCYNFFNYSPVHLNLILSKYNGVFAVENWYYIFYFLIYIILFILSVNYYVQERKLKKIFNVLLISSIVMGLFIFISPIFDKGNIILIIFIITFITCILAREIDVKMYSRFVLISFYILVVYYISMFGIIKYIDFSRNNYIKEQLDNNSSNIVVRANPIYLVWRYNPTDYFQLKDFKEYYGIDEDKNIEVKHFGVFEEIEKKVKE